MYSERGRYVINIYISREISIEHLSVGLASLAQLCHQKKIVIGRTRDLIYLKFVATDFSPKISSPSTGENSGDSA